VSAGVGGADMDGQAKGLGLLTYKRSLGGGLPAQTVIEVGDGETQHVLAGQAVQDVQETQAIWPAGDGHHQAVAGRQEAPACNKVPNPLLEVHAWQRLEYRGIIALGRSGSTRIARMARIFLEGGEGRTRLQGMEGGGFT